MLLLIWLTLILLGLLLPKSKLITVMIFGFMIVVIGFRTQGADYIVYQNEFKWAEHQGFSSVHYVGFLILEKLMYRIGIKFEQFLVIVGSFSVCLVFFGVSKLTKNINRFLSLYLIYPFTHEAIQTRTFLANSIIIAALPLIILDEGKDAKKTVIKRVLFFSLGALACTFHFEAAIYVAFVVFMIILPHKNSKIYILLTSSIVFLLVETGVLAPIVANFNTRISYWVSGKTGLGIIFPISITLLLCLSIMMVIKSIKKITILNESQNAFFANSEKFGWLLILLIPFFCFDITFNRLWRLFLIVLYALIAEAWPLGIKKKSKENIIIVVSILLLSLVVYEGELRLLYGIMENNGIFKQFSVW